MKSHCPQCQSTNIHFSSSLVGGQVRCNQCKQLFLVTHLDDFAQFFESLKTYFDICSVCKRPVSLKGFDSNAVQLWCHTHDETVMCEDAEAIALDNRTIP